MRLQAVFYGCGGYLSYPGITPLVETIDPEPGQQAAHRELFPVFEAAFQALVPIYDQLDAQP